MHEDKKASVQPESILTQEQDAILDMYLENLDNVIENIRKAEKIEVDIETLHLKRILTRS